VNWAAFEGAAPDLAAAGRRLLYREGGGKALLATVRDGAPPRIHPITVAIVDEGLYAFILPSPKLVDLERDGRYALHTLHDPAAPSEFAIRGHAQLVVETAERSAVAAGWRFEVDEMDRLFEFSIESALLGERHGPHEWPPRYTSWTVAGR
jgi:hypothetical protein